MLLKRKERDYTIDIAKAIGILLMILGHVSGIPSILRNFIFSFHMPLFFIFSGYFYKPSNSAHLVKKGIEKFIKPYIITSVVSIVLCLTAQMPEDAKDKFMGMMLGNGGGVFYGGANPVIGPTWFLLALFWCRILYNRIQSRVSNILLFSFMFSTIAFVFGKYVSNLPFGILYGACGLVFYSMGDYWKRKGIKINSCYIIIGIVIWIISIILHGLEMASFNCRLYPLSMIGAFIGTYLVYLLSKKTPSFARSFLIWIGQNTMLILCYHTLTFFILRNLKCYYFEPKDIELNVSELIVLFFICGLCLPYLHKIIQKSIVSCISGNTK